MKFDKIMKEKQKLYIFVKINGIKKHEHKDHMNLNMKSNEKRKKMGGWKRKLNY